MSTKSSAHQVVEFYAVSSSKCGKSPARLPKVRQLDPASFRRPQVAKQTHKTIVVLSHADDDPHALREFIKSHVKPAGSKPLHLLITEPGTHPDQVRQWNAAANISNSKRFIVCQIGDPKTPQLAQLLGRVRRALEHEERGAEIVDAYVAGDFLYVRGPKLRMLHVPIRSVPAFKGRDLDEIRNLEVDVDGSFISWPGLDVHLGWEQLLQIVDPAALRKAQQRSKVFNQRYGAAIRSVREKAGIAQSKIEGLTERQVRRIEQGECRATSSAITALSKAHALMPNDYMESVAKAMK